MKNLILTALDNNDIFWFDHLVPFLLSLNNTGYQGNIGVISYGLSERKKEILKKNGYLIFDAENKYKTIYIDRQYTAAIIAEKFDFDFIALFDTDIWFPAPELTLFSEIKNIDSLYCCYDVTYGDFVEGCVYKQHRPQIRQLIQQFLYKHKNLWQVGVVVGAKNAWIKYNQYMMNSLNKGDVFTQEYGIDTLLIALYSIQEEKVLPLPTKYNCIPTCGKLKHSNINQQGKITNEYSFTVDNESVQAIHITGPFRLYERNFYEFFEHCGINYFENGKEFRLEEKRFNTIKSNGIEQLFLNVDNKNFHVLKLLRVQSETPVSFSRNSDNLFINVGCKTHLTLKNENNISINLHFTIQHPLGKRITKGRFIYYQQKTPTIYPLNKWSDITLNPNEEVTLVSYDIDTDAELIWVLHQVQLS